MNIFLPYADNVVKSVQCLDQKRLAKQILEAKTLLDFALGNSTAYGKHPVAQFFKGNPDFLAYYGMQCCVEYTYRTSKYHSSLKEFVKYFETNVEGEWGCCKGEPCGIGCFANNKKEMIEENIRKIDILLPIKLVNHEAEIITDGGNIDGHATINLSFIEPDYVPYYMEGSKNTPECIRFSGNAEIVSKLFQAKLIKKWLNDKRQPTFGTRGMPDFLKEYLELCKSAQKLYWEDIEQLKIQCRKTIIHFKNGSTMELLKAEGSHCGAGRYRNNKYGGD